MRAEPTSGWNVKWPAIRAWGRSHSRVYWIGGRRIRAALKAPSGKGRKWARDHHGVRPAPARSSRSPWRAVRAAAPVASCSCCSARSGRSCRRALSAHSRCCRGVIKKCSGGSSIIGIYPSLTVSSPCCTHRALHRRCNVGAFRTPITLANARRCRPTRTSAPSSSVLIYSPAPAAGVRLLSYPVAGDGFCPFL